MTDWPDSPDRPPAPPGHARIRAILDVESVVPFLLECELIDAGWIVEGTLGIRSLARRNRNLRIDGPDGRGFLLKQPDDPAGVETLRRERTFHEFCRCEPAAAPVIPSLPTLVHGRDDPVALVFERIAGAVTLDATWGAEAISGLDVAAARALGWGLGTLHRVFGGMDLGHESRLAWLPRDRPTVLDLHQPGPTLLATVSPANIETLRILQSSEVLGDHLDRLRGRWRPETVIHGDIRPDNVLVRAPRAEEAPDRPELWITDWEMVQVGDPAWDLAGALQGVLVAWVTSMPLADADDARELADRARLPLVDLHASTRAIWAGYRDAGAMDPDRAEDLLRRAIAFATARLIQSAWELAAESDQLPGHAALLLQVGENLAAEPGRGRLELFGLAPGPVAP
jgi:hypothetical protein